MALSIALLDASGGDDPAPDNFRRVFEVPLDVYDVRAGERPDTDVDAAVLSGSTASAYWDREWIVDLQSWVREAAAAGVPMLGVCFGHQLLADALGGRVVGRDAYELGYHEVEHVPDSRLFDGVPRQFTAFVAHSDDVVALPDGARRLAANDYSLHAFRRERVFGVQFHAEFDFDTARRVARSRKTSVERTPDAAETLTEANARAARAATAVFENFAAFAREVRGQ